MEPDEKAGPAMEPEQTPLWALESTNLANERLGAKILFATDEVRISIDEVHLLANRNARACLCVLMYSCVCLCALFPVTVKWFARAENLLNPSPATFDPNAYSLQGKTLDGWESRRRRIPGHDWSLITIIDSHGSTLRSTQPPASLYSTLTRNLSTLHVDQVHHKARTSG